MKGKELQAILKGLNLSLPDVADILHYRPDGVRSWIRRNAEIPEESARKIVALAKQTIAKQRQKHKDVELLLILLSSKTDR